MKQAYQIANIFGLDMNNAQHSIAVLDALGGIEDKDRFVEYARSSKDDIKFAAKTEKLDTIATRYKRDIQKSKLIKHIDKAREYAKKLTEKVVSCRHTVEERSCKFEHVFLDGSPYFEEHEIRALSRIGSPPVVIMYSRDNELEEIIYDKYMRVLEERLSNTKTIEHKKEDSTDSRRAKRLVESAIKRI